MDEGQYMRDIILWCSATARLSQSTLGLHG